MKLGFFHYGNPDKSEPVTSLLGVLTRRAAVEPVAGSLIVLPEAFNIGKPYYDASTRPNTDAAIVGVLQAVAREFRLAFVAGLVLKDDAGLPYSGAYLVTRQECTALSYKRTADDTAYFSNPNYQSYPREWHYPVAYGEACVGALVCADATPFVPAAISDIRERQRLIRDRMAGPCRILAVPVCMSSHYSACGIADEWPDAHVIVANSHPTGCGSHLVVRGRHERSLKAAENDVILLGL